MPSDELLNCGSLIGCGRMDKISNCESSSEGDSSDDVLVAILLDVVDGGHDDSFRM